MPHVVIEYSANLADHHDVDALVAAVHAAGLEHGLAPKDGLRTRAIRCDHYRVATGDPTFAFVAMGVRIGPGRTEQAKTSFIEALLAGARAHIGETPPERIKPLHIMWSIELQEIDPAFRINHNEVRAHLESEPDDSEKAVP